MKLPPGNSFLFCQPSCGCAWGAGLTCTKPLQAAATLLELPLQKKPKATFIRRPSLRLQNDDYCQNYAKCWDSAFLHFFRLVGTNWEV